MCISALNPPYNPDFYSEGSEFGFSTLCLSFDGLLLATGHCLGLIQVGFSVLKVADQLTIFEDVECPKSNAAIWARGP